MGIELPPDDGPSGIACNIYGMPDMPPIWLSITGVVTSAPETWTPNGLHKLKPYWACQWRKKVDEGTANEKEFVVSIGNNDIDVLVWWPVRFIFVYEQYQIGYSLFGHNVFYYPALYSEGDHQILMTEPGTPESMTDLKDSLRVINVGKTFGEPMGVDLSQGKKTQRLANVADGTCVYIKR